MRFWPYGHVNLNFFVEDQETENTTMSCSPVQELYLAFAYEYDGNAGLPGYVTEVQILIENS